MNAARTMYMHTLKGKPANFSDLYEPVGMYFATGRTRAQLVPTLRQIRSEQARAIAANAEYPSMSEWADPKVYGYVLVEVPA